MTAVNVTAGHIAEGEPGNCERCAVALAIRDTFPDLPYSLVGPEEITMGPIDAETSLPTPREAVFFMLVFDNGDHVEPFTFELDYPAVTA